MLKSKLQLSVDIYRELIEPVIDRGRVEGIIRSEGFDDVCAQLDSAGLLIASDKAKSTVKYQALSSKAEYFSPTFSDLLAAGSRRKEAPQDFYIADFDYLHSEINESTPEQVQGYLDAVSLYALLRKIADHGKEIDSDCLVFFNKEKVDLFVSYSANEIQPLEKLEDFKSRFIEDEIHSDQKATIVKVVLLELSKEFEEPLSLGLITENFDEFYRRVSSGYQLYVSEFSFQKVKAEVEKSKLEFISRINKVFSDIQNQLLTVPAALIIAGSQYEKSNHLTLKNGIITAGVIVFSLFMILLIVNQWNTLRSIIREVDSEWSLIKNKHEMIKLQFTDQYLALVSRYKYQYALLEMVALIVVIACSAAILLCFYFSDNEVLPIELSIFLAFSFLSYLGWRTCVFLKILFSKLEGG